MLPPIHIPARITREFVQEHFNDYYFLYGTAMGNFSDSGQASVGKWYRNCYWVPTKWRLCSNAGYFQDSELEVLVKPVVIQQLLLIPQSRPLIPFPNIGCGWAKMPTRAPLCYSWLMSEIKKLAYPNIIYVP